MDTGYIIYVIDTETTGLDAKEHDIIELSVCRFRMSNPDLAEQKTWCLKALNPISISDEALAINKHKREDILHFTKFGRETYKEPNQVVAEIERWILSDDVSVMDRIIAGQNIRFDINAMQELWKKVGSYDTFPFDLKKNRRIVDTIMLTTIIDLCVGRRRKHYNLGSLVKSFNVTKRRAHRAEDDVAMTKDLLVKLLNPLKEQAKMAFDNSYED